ncbi:MAG TPA: DNA double-strand break repair nuclease NurA, partial [Anaerolineae bacterium]
LQEIELMADLCVQFRMAGIQPVAVADASIVPFALLNEPFVKNNTRRAALLLERITRALDSLRASNAVIAGYIDRPNSNALARTCSLADVPPAALSSEQRMRDSLRRVAQDTRGINDRFLLEPILRDGHRTALFEPTWLVNGPAYLGHSGHTMKACYLNVGAGRPAIVRIEMPEWCADVASVDLLTGIMQRHANMGAGYPLILKAAHEEAVLTASDEAGIDLMIERGMINQGILAMPSQKQEAKDKR